MTTQVECGIEMIETDALLTRVRSLRDAGCRLVQVSATRLPEQFELTYSFSLGLHLTNLRLLLPATDPRVPSISGIFGSVLLYENEMHDLFGIQVESMAVDFQGKLYQTAVKFAFGK